MPRMPIRATYALDEQTDQNIRRLAKAWHVSQAEVIRRSVKAAADQAESRMTPAEVVAWYRTHPLPRGHDDTLNWIGEVHAWRHEDDELRDRSATRFTWIPMR